MVYPLGTVKFKSCKTSTIVDSLLLKGSECPTDTAEIVLSWANRKSNTSVLDTFIKENGYPSLVKDIPYFSLYLYNSDFLKDFLDKLTVIDPSLIQISDKLISSSKLFKQTPTPKFSGWIKRNDFQHRDSQGNLRVSYTNCSSNPTIEVLILEWNAEEKQHRLDIRAGENGEDKLKDVLENTVFSRPKNNAAKGYTMLAYERVPDIKFLESFLNVAKKAEPFIANIMTDVLESFQPGYISNCKLAFLMGLEKNDNNKSPIRQLENSAIREPKLTTQVFSYLFETPLPKKNKKDTEPKDTVLNDVKEFPKINNF